MNKFLSLAFGFSALACASVQAEQLTIERIFDNPTLLGKSMRGVKVAPDGARVTFLQGRNTDYNHYDLWEYHVDSGETRILVDSNTLHSGPEQLSDEEKARRERQRIYGKGIMEYHWSADGKALLFPLAGDVYYFDLAGATAKQLTKTEGFETDVKFSPKGNYISYIRNQNLYVMHIASGKEQAITTKGGGSIKYGMAEFVAQEEMGRMTGYWWSPDEAHIAFTKVDESNVEIQVRNEIYADQIKLFEQRYPAAGTPNAVIELAISNINTGNIQWVDLGGDKDFYLPRVKWFADSQQLSYQYQSRDQQTLDLMAYDLVSKTSKSLIQETSDSWVNLHADLRFLKDKQHFIWASERDGYKHLYLYKTNGQLVRQLTQGQWVVNSLKRIDQKNGKIYFTGRKDTPREQHLYRVAMTGGNVERVSSRPGFHKVNFAKEGDIYVDNFSSNAVLPQVSVHNASGKHIAWLEQNKVDSNHPYGPYANGIVTPEYGELIADDGQTLLYELYKPRNLKSNQKLPVILYVYGGPKVGQQVTNSWSRNQFLTQYWVEQGYVVFSLDNRGSYNRGKAFESPIYKHLGVVEVADQLKGVEFLKSLPYVDSAKIGVFGHSYGGYMAQILMYKQGQEFAAGISGAPVTDWLLYDTHYTERYLGHPKSNAEGYQASSVFPYVKNLSKPLLIYHGMADDNVLFTNATKVFSDLQKHNKRFDMMTYPGAKHSMRGKATKVHLNHTIMNFFNQHLKGE
ncbi:S9 family peptidase [Neiella marina]|uniref:S9 family peptidase n=1 Tax=Neiella holothuriorum TaxID=2870530 RepID=A0ABS7EGU8_9GAMM|nr:S9 family peptidase [Neiella holothuriorum]MBW8191505.1 S9 family peptidase [Neiella holothuriorum]